MARSSSVRNIRGVMDVPLRIPDLRLREGPQEGLGEEEAQDGRQGGGDQADGQQGSGSQGHVFSLKTTKDLTPPPAASPLPPPLS
jgi:hypothetical protein